MLKIFFLKFCCTVPVIINLGILSNQCKAPVIVKIQFYEQYLETQILSDQDLTVES
jgi:hypothetical protein